MVAIDQPACTGCDLCLLHCPFEALQPLLEKPSEAKRRPVVVLMDRCVGCLSCIGSCPTDALHEIDIPIKSEVSPLIIDRSNDPRVEKVVRWTAGSKDWA